MLGMRGDLVAEEARIFRFLFIPHLLFIGAYFIFGVCSSCLVSCLPIFECHTTPFMCPLQLLS